MKPAAAPVPPLLKPSDELVLILQRSYRNEQTHPELEPTFSNAGEAISWLKQQTASYEGLF